MGRARKSGRVRVALVKAESEWGDVKGNVALLEHLARPLVDRGIDVLVTPECFLDGYMVRDKERVTARKLRARCVTGPADPVVRRVGRLARRLRSYLVLGASEKDARGVVRNAAYLIGRDGNVVGTYYKIHTCDLYEPGNALPVFETDFGTVGIVICADRRWPENIRCMALAGARLVLNPTWGFKGELNTAIVRVRAYENAIPVCFAHPTQSLVCDGKGDVVALLESSEPGVLVHDLDLAWRPPTPAVPDRAWSHPATFRRPDLYGPICDEVGNPKHEAGNKSQAGRKKRKKQQPGSAAGLRYCCIQP